MAELDKVAEKEVLNSKNLEDFKLSQILFNFAEKRTIGLLGVFPESETEKAIIILEKVEFAEENFKAGDEGNSVTKHTRLEVIQVNDIYGKYFGETDPKFNSKFVYSMLSVDTKCSLIFVLELKVSMIYPATQKHIDKYTQQSVFMIDETPETYQNVTLPLLEKEQFSLDWVYNILDHKQEVDKILFEDLDPKTGFILLPDYKWNGQVESMYLQAIINARDIKSIRDLNASHLPLLENIKAKSLATIKEKYGLDSTQVRAYFHYQPSFYHLHVHFTFIKYDAPGIYCGKAHLLGSIIDNIRLIPDYYQKATLPFVVGEKSSLYLAIKESQAQKQ